MDDFLPHLELCSGSSILQQRLVASNTWGLYSKGIHRSDAKEWTVKALDILEGQLQSYSKQHNHLHGALLRVSSIKQTNTDWTALSNTRKSNPFHGFLNGLSPVCLKCVPALNISSLKRNFTAFQLSDLHYYPQLSNLR